jgi:hypothetical protein
VLVMVPKADMTTCTPMFLGVVLGFNEEYNSYKEYEAPLRQHKTTLTLVSEQTGLTNEVALSVKTIANPNLTFVTPVFELVNIRNNREFQEAVLGSWNMESRYETYDSLPCK